VYFSLSPVLARGGLVMYCWLGRGAPHTTGFVLDYLEHRYRLGYRVLFGSLAYRQMARRLIRTELSMAIKMKGAWIFTSGQK
ncbi:MAG: hypothetical protein AAFR31_16315, partial [Cyanobacteria bacterium J06627_8]